VTTHGLTKIFGHLPAVDTLNLGVKGGELFGLLGPNGAGKTTTVRMLCTLIEPTSGTAEVGGYDIREDPADVRRSIGVVSEGVSLYKDLTIEENLKLLSTLYDIPHARAERRINELMEMFSFSEKSKRLVGALSTGWAKKAMICAAMLHEPSILFLDEVTSGLDPQSAIALQEFTKNLCKQGVTVIWTTHYMTEPEKICDRVGIMFGGRLVQVGTPNELRHSVSELSTIEAETPGLSEKQLEELEKKFQSLMHLHACTYEDPSLVVTCSKTDKLVQNVVDALVGVEAKINGIQMKEPSLEEAFIALTGGEEEIDRFLEGGEQKKRSS
jgi:ABC-2 type transport system ATP-binding protein